MYEQVRRLSKYHQIDLFSLEISNQDFCDIRPFTEKSKIYKYQPSVLFTSPLGRLNQFQRWRDLFRLEQLAKIIARDVDSQGYDVVFVHPCIWTQAPLILKYLKTKSVYYLQEPPRHLYEHHYEKDENNWRKPIDNIDPLISLYRDRARKLDLAATQSAGRVLVNSKFMATVVSRIYQIQPEICYLGIDPEVFRPLSLVNRQGYLLSVGAILPHKGYDFIIESMSKIPQALRPMLKLVGNIGDPAEHLKLVEISNNLGVKLTVEIDLPINELLLRYNQAELFVYASYNEPFGFAPLEAMACGTPVVAVAEGGVCETVVDDVTGRLVPRNADAFGDTVLDLLQSTRKRANYSKNCVQYIIDKWSWEKTVPVLSGFLGLGS
jgi:glycosyltransferase involved in cell wall biosynthesis